MIPVRDVIPSRTTPLVTVALIALTTLVSGYILLLPPATSRDVYLSLGVVPDALRPVTILTSLAVHGDWSSLLANNLYLWIFGDSLEDRLGHGRFFAFYLASGALAACAHAAMAASAVPPLVGATGAVAGILGAYVVTFPRSRVLALVPLPGFVRLVEVPAMFLLGGWFLLGLAAEVRPAGTLPPRYWDALDWPAHAAALFFGATAVFGVRRPERQRVEWWSP